MSDSVTPPALGYAQSTLALRPPRVAIVFPAPTEAWTFYARIALHQANHIWGGSGFVLVPHSDGKVSVSILDAVAAYDPDYVVAATFTLNERLAGEPGFLSTVDGPDTWTPEHKVQFLERAGDEQAPDMASNSARDTVALACEVYRRRDTTLQNEATEGLASDGTAGPPGDRSAEWTRGWEEADESCMFLSDDSHLTGVDTFGDPAGFNLSAPPDLGGPWGAMVAATTGALIRPRTPGDDVPLTEEDSVALTRWFYQRMISAERMEESPPPSRLIYSPTAAGLSVKPEDQPNGWLYTQTGLVPVGQGNFGRRKTVIIGDTAQDFALALIVDRLWGNGFWIPHTWSPSADGAVGRAARDGTRRSLLRMTRARSLVLTSATKSAEELEEFTKFFDSGIVSHRARLESGPFVRPRPRPNDPDHSDAAERSDERSEDAARPGQASHASQAEVSTPNRTSPPTTEVHPEPLPKASATPVSESAGAGLATSGERALGEQGEPGTASEHGPDVQTEQLAVGDAPVGSSSPAGSPARRELNTVTIEWPLNFRPTDRRARPGTRGLAVSESYATVLALPVVTTDEATEFAVALPAQTPVPTKLVNNPKLRWHVDLTVERSLMPYGRGLDGHTLIVESDDAWETWVRSGHRSISYESHRDGILYTAATLEQQLARPRLQVHSLYGWTRQRAAQAGYDIAYSDAGRRAHLLALMWGSRDAMSDDFAGRFTAVAAAFTRTGDGTKAVYPHDEGVYIAGSGGYLNFSGLRDIYAPVRPLDPDDGDQPVPATLDDVKRSAETRAKLDRLVSRGILRRGLALLCATCAQAAFVPIDKLSQVNTCPRCGSPSDLIQHAWRLPVDEPTWFYDLHPVARSLYTSNGHAPLLLASYLRARARTFTDVAELELFETGSHKPLAETDLLAHSDGFVLTGEVKTNDRINDGSQTLAKAARKRVIWASAVRADEIVLATTTPAWQATSVAAVSDAIAAGANDGLFPPHRTPRLRVITGLGTSDINDSYP